MSQYAMDSCRIKREPIAVQTIPPSQIHPPVISCHLQTRSEPAKALQPLVTDSFSKGATATKLASWADVHRARGESTASLSHVNTGSLMATAVDERRAVILRTDDNVAVAARPIPRGFALAVGDRIVEVREPIALGHKVAIVDIDVGEPVRKYGQIIGFAARAIPAGSWVHVQNVKADLFERDYAFATERPSVPPRGEVRTFRGFARPDGRVGTRNYIAVISTVNCSASTSKYIAERFRDKAWKRDFPNVDGVFAITHKGGCGLPFGGMDHTQLERVLAGFANHPNVAAYVIV